MVFSQLLAQVEGLFAWYNAVFVVLFGIGLFFTFLQLIGLGQGAGVEADADADVDADLAADMDADADLAADVDADTDLDADAHIDADAGVDGDAHMDAHAPADAAGHVVGLGGAMAQLFALGKVPVSMSLMLLCYTVGITGWALNELIQTRLGDPARFFPLTLLVALVVGFIVLRFASSLMSRYLPSVSTTAIQKRQLVGMTAKAVLPINEKFGQACLYDRHGTLHMVGCRVRKGAANIEKGAQVILIKYIPDRDLFEVGRA